MRLTIKPSLPLKFTPAPPQEPPPWRWCRPAITPTTSHQPNQTTRQPPKNRLEHLLVDSGKGPTTRTPGRIGMRWMEYHGANNWEGLLDPLDEDLRHEIIRYGNFVEATYQSFDFDPSSPTYAMCRYSKNSMLEQSGVHESGYRVMRHLCATSSIPLPQWMERVLRQVRVQSSWIGYVAVCSDKKEIARLGRRDVVIALRGTATCLEWLENFRATLTRYTFCSGDRPRGPQDDPMVESGFLSLYTSGSSNCPSLQRVIKEEILRVLRKYGDEPLSITITGHSLGAALAILAAYDIKTTIKDAPHVNVISFGGPRVGNRSFRQKLERQGTKILRIVNSDDLITKLPGFFVQDHEDVPQEQKARLAVWIQNHVKDSQWVYADIGRELRLSSRDSLQLNSINVATCHDLKTYLDLVSSTCPFKARARRMLKKATTTPPTFSVGSEIFFCFCILLVFYNYL